MSKLLQYIYRSFLHGNSPLRVAVGLSQGATQGFAHVVYHHIAHHERCVSHHRAVLQHIIETTTFIIDHDRIFTEQYDPTFQ